MAINEQSNDDNVPAVRGENTARGSGISGHSIDGRAVEGWSTNNYGVTGDSTLYPGVRGTSTKNRGVEGWSTEDDGLFGISEKAPGVHGINQGQGSGVVGESKNGRGVTGFVQIDSADGTGVWGECNSGRGVVGVSISGTGVWGHTTRGRGVVGVNNDEGTGVWGETQKGNGVVGISQQDIGVFGKGGRFAGSFDGDVEVTRDVVVKGDIRLTDGHGDCAEDFDVTGADKVEPGTVMVLDNEGALSESRQAYDKRVAGVISGAGDYKPGIVLDKRHTSGNRQPIALLGKVFCKVDARFGAIEVGDLLTTSPTPGHAMKTSDPFKAFGAVIGKALRPLKDGQGLIPILIALQ